MSTVGAAMLPIDEPTLLEQRLRAVPAPKALFDRAREESLTARQREILDEIGRLFEQGFASLTMAEIAAQLRCSLRSLYALAPSRNELVLIVVDRNIWRVGRSAMRSIDPSMDALEALRTYLEAATEVVNGTTEAFARDLVTLPAAQRLSDAHAAYVVAITKCLLDLAIEQGQIIEVDTSAVACVMATLSRQLSQPDVISTLRTTPKEAADSMLDIMLRGMSTEVDRG
jgi:AcrR family transcriptional regulator